MSAAGVKLLLREADFADRQARDLCLLNGHQAERRDNEARARIMSDLAKQLRADADVLAEHGGEG